LLVIVALPDTSAPVVAPVTVLLVSVAPPATLMPVVAPVMEFPVIPALEPSPTTTPADPPEMTFEAMAAPVLAPATVIAAPVAPEMVMGRCATSTPALVMVSASPVAPMGGGDVPPSMVMGDANVSGDPRAIGPATANWIVSVSGRRFASSTAARNVQPAVPAVHASWLVASEVSPASLTVNVAARAAPGAANSASTLASRSPRLKKPDPSRPSALQQGGALAILAGPDNVLGVRGTTRIATLCLILLAGLVPAARAVDLGGSRGPDAMLGTKSRDRIFALGGGDIIVGLGGRDLLRGGSGVDVIEGDGTCARDPGENLENCAPTTSGSRDTIEGGSGDDAVYGDGGSDAIRGDSGSDAIEGDAGNDTIRGDSGNDIISGGSGNDQINAGTGADRVSGGSGRDLINVRDGKRDRVSCGSGRDRVLADAVDRVAKDCERVQRSRRRR
jgi:hypothetical protein